MSEHHSMLQYIVHYSFHFLVPGLISYIVFKEYWIRAWLIMVATMAIDIDHLLAQPFYDPNRCSVNFHPLHTYWALAVYVGLLFFKKTKIIAIGLVFHIFTDFIDCLWN